MEEEADLAKVDTIKGSPMSTTSTTGKEPQPYEAEPRVDDEIDVSENVCVRGPVSMYLENNTEIRQK